MRLTETTVRSVLTRTGGFLAGVASHSLQPYRGCALGNSLCGVGCYVRGNPWVTQGRPWGSFVEVRVNAADAYTRQYDAERAWGRRAGGRFGVFLSSSTEPFQPAEATHGVTRSVLLAMTERPPDRLIVQTHSDRVLSALDVLATLDGRCDLRVHVSIESDADGLPGLPPPAVSVARRVDAGRRLREAGVFAVATVAPLLPVIDPDGFFATLADAFDAVVIDHFVGGDGTPDGTRTRRTALPLAMAAVRPDSVTIAYRNAMVEVARRHCVRVGVGPDGFAGRFLAPSPVVRNGRYRRHAGLGRGRASRGPHEAIPLPASPFNTRTPVYSGLAPHARPHPRPLPLRTTGEGAAARRMIDPMATPKPAKLCQRCGREMTWRKKWEKTWDAVKFCSDACRRGKPTGTDSALERAIVALLAARAPDATICPSEAARAVSPDDWATLMEPARRAGRRLAMAGAVLVTQGGRVVDAATARGPIRYRRGPRFKAAAASGTDAARPASGGG